MFMFSCNDGKMMIYSIWLQVVKASFVSNVLINYYVLKNLYYSCSSTPPPPICFFRWIPLRNISPSSQECSFVPIIFSCIYSKSLLKYTKSLICCEFCCLSINRYKIILQIILKIYTLYYISVKIWDEGLFWDEWSNWDEPSKNKRRFAMYRSLMEGKWMVETSLYRTPLMSELRCVRRV